MLEEDGTVVDTEEFFQTLRDNTHFMILEKGQKWTPVSMALLCKQQLGRHSTYERTVWFSTGASHTLIL